MYRRLSSHGFSQRRIANLTGQSSSEIYEIVKGRQVMAYDVLVRIADGLGVPRGYMGLAYDGEPMSVIEDSLAGVASGPGEVEEVRQLLSHAANVTMGVSVHEASRWWQPTTRVQTPVPGMIGETDVTQLEHITGVLRALDYRHGGGACRDAVVAQADYARLLLTSDSTGEVKERLHLALADLHNLAGWTSFDVGLYSVARRHFSLALEQAKACDDLSLVANVLYRLGRLHLHQDYLSQALRFFQLGQLAAQDAEDPLTVAMLHANEAWTHALMGCKNKALSSLGRAQDEFVRPRTAGPPGWVSFFGEADLRALTGIVHGLLCSIRKGDEHVSGAISNLEQSIKLRKDPMARSMTFELTALATVQLRAGSCRDGMRSGERAVDLAERVRSVRTVDRLTPLLDAVRQHSDEETASLAGRIATLQGG
ncbi:helix-turn-helix domain-containing protein [Couchioplanes caeruleus]|uniref:helix-turn-helix domain-containing protein n=1 Tax=Couchioplanes caeruleus TaxID=56438 RepID=UPI0020BE6292|nr:helix-turn-helix transcriptional regulator [Couchioplanes caeruleus]UQU66822.1 helix-turn-helix domain-containing protein [Couchioplanes caeruleus]